MDRCVPPPRPGGRGLALALCACSLGRVDHDGGRHDVDDGGATSVTDHRVPPRLRRGLADRGLRAELEADPRRPPTRDWT